LLRLDASNAGRHEGAHQRVLGARTRRGRQIGELDVGAARDQRYEILPRVFERDVGREAAIEVQDEEIGNDVPTATAISRLRDGGDRAVREPFDERLSRLERP
jgi:hypothetical protein